MRCIAGFIMVASLIIAGPNVWAGVPTHNWTADTDFDQGTLENVNHDSPNNDQLQLNPGISVTLPFIWVANSDEGTISKINTDTGQELGRYRTGPGGDNPSRTTVDLNGDVWVGNRNSASATKVALIPQDRNGDGIINTSGDKNSNGMIDPGEVVDIKPWGTDEAVIVRVSAPGGTRAVAVDASNNVWIGGTDGSGVDPYYMRYYDGATGAYLNKKVWVGRACYGALIDGNGTLWVSNDGNNTLTRINNPTADGATAQIINPGTGWVYGLGIDTEGFIYCSGWTNNRFRKYNPTTSSWVYDIPTGKSGGRGVCVGLDGTVWVAHSYSNQVTRHNPANGAIIATVNVGNHPTGVAVDNNGKIWVTNYYGSSIMRIDPATNAVDFTQGGHPGPYNYSDMTGAISQSITTKNGKWSDVFDSGCDYSHWGTVTWNSSVPAGTSITVSIRVAGTEAGLASATWVAVSNGVEISPAVAGRFVEIKAEFTISSGTVSPVLYDLSIQGAETIISVFEAALCGKINMYCYPWNG
ncbi:MAG: Vgb family protein, partial [Candidatus Latescibacterota bacterium]